MRRIKFKFIIIVVIIVLFLATITTLFYYYKTFTNQNNNQKLYNKVLSLTKENSNLKLQINDLQNSLINVKNKFISFESKLTSLESKISEFENLNPVTSEKNVLIVVLIYKIKELYYNNKTFNNELDDLKKITKNKTNIYLDVVKLDNFVNPSNVADIFNKEYKKLLTMNSSNKIEKFINQNIQIRKVKNIDDSDNIIDKHIEQIKYFIDNNNYEDALNIIIKNKYDNILVKTKESLSKNIEFNSILDNILNNIYINY